MTPAALKQLMADFPLLADAPGGIARLREMILQLAVQGKLVPQNPKDEPAAELLKKIKAEKERLVKAGKIRAPKSLPFIELEDVPFGLPEGWEWVRLEDIFKFIDYRGKTPQKTSQGVRLITAKNIRMGFIKREPEEFISEKTYKEWMTRGFPRVGDLLFTTEAPLGNVALLDITEKIALAQRSINLQPYLNPDTKYLLYAIMSKHIQNLIIEKATGMTATGIKAAKLKLIPVPLPPLPEQHRIVARVDELMALCDELEAQQTARNATRTALTNASLGRLMEATEPKAFHTNWKRIADHFDWLTDTPESVKQLRQTILQLAVQGKLVPQNPKDEPAAELLKKIKAEKEGLIKAGKIRKPKPLPPIEAEDVPFELPRGWEWARLEEIVIFGPKNGYSPKGVDFPTNCKSLTLSATTSGSFNGDCFKYLDIEVEAESHLWLKEGDILIQRGNSLEYVGIAAVYNGKPNRFIYPDLMMKIRIAKSISLSLFHYIINSPISREYFQANASGTSGSMPKVNQAIVNALPLPLPPISEQQRIVARVDELMALCDKLEARLTRGQKQAAGLVEAVVATVAAG